MILMLERVLLDKSKEYRWEEEYMKVLCFSSAITTTTAMKI